MKALALAALGLLTLISTIAIAVVISMFDVPIGRAGAAAFLISACLSIPIHRRIQ